MLKFLRDLYEGLCEEFGLTGYDTELSERR